MSDSLNNSAQSEKAVETTIVGGRPAGRGQGYGDIPHGIEVLLKKASVDASFRQVLLQDRAKAVREIGLGLTMAEATILKTTSVSQLEAIIENTRVPDAQHPVFLGRDVTVMLEAIAANCTCLTCRRTKGEALEDDPDPRAASMGIQPDFPKTKGIRPDLPMYPVPTGIRPDPPSTTRGICPDLPPTLSPEDSLSD
ncbi:MAG: hypothetical protein GY832_07510 [Chloroflexi bacterium]|nr:hypothetical protein [Chloroflexota bacterium]